MAVLHLSDRLGTRSVAEGCRKSLSARNLSEIVTVGVCSVLRLTVGPFVPSYRSSVPPGLRYLVKGVH